MVTHYWLVKSNLGIFMNHYVHYTVHISICLQYILRYLQNSIKFLKGRLNLRNSQRTTGLFRNIKSKIWNPRQKIYSIKIIWKRLSTLRGGPNYFNVGDLLHKICTSQCLTVCQFSKKNLILRKDSNFALIFYVIRTRCGTSSVTLSLHS